MVDAMLWQPKCKLRNMERWLGILSLLGMLCTYVVAQDAHVRIYNEENKLIMGNSTGEDAEVRLRGLAFTPNLVSHR